MISCLNLIKFEGDWLKLHYITQENQSRWINIIRGIPWGSGQPDTETPWVYESATLEYHIKAGILRFQFPERAAKLCAITDSMIIWPYKGLPGIMKTDTL